MIRYPSPDAYDRPHAFSVIPEDQEQHSSWTWRSLAGLAAYKATTWTGYYAGRLPLKTKTNYLDLGIAHAGLTWKSMVGGQTQIQDWVLNLIKGFEEETPFHLGRTFGLTEFLSPYVLGNRVDLKIPKDIVNAHHNYYRTLIQQVSDVDQTGQPITRGLRDQDWAGGMHLRGGKLYGILETGEEKELLGFARPRLAHWYPPKVQGIEHPPLHGRLSEAYQQILARSRGGGSRRLIQDNKFPFHIVGSARSKNILGFDVPWRHYLREAQSVAEMWNRRFFKLLDSPVELLRSAGAQTESIPGLTRAASFVDKIGLTNRLGLGGDYSGNILQQWGRWLRPGMGKSGFRPGALLTFVGLPFAYHAVDQYLRGREELKGTLVEHGLSGAAANVWQKLMLGRARFGQLSGLSAIARAQESVAPNSTDPATMLGLPLGIGIIGGVYGFGASRLNRQDGIEKVWQRIKLPEHEFTGALRRFFSGKYTRSGKLFRGGLAIGAVLEAPFLLGAAARFLGGLKSPEDLKRIYSGEEEVPVRHGRLWEFGSCIGCLTEIPTSSTETKFAPDIIEGDLIIGSNGKSARVKHVWSRHHQGNILKIITAIDRYRPTWLTDNHIVPAIKKIDSKNDPKRTKVQPQEIPAGELQPGDFVQVPLCKLPSRRYNLLDLKNFIKCGGEWMLSWNPKAVFQEQPYFLHYEGNLYIQIVSIEQEQYNDLVYDFEIESHDHLFQAGAFLIHNSHYTGTKVDYYRPHWTVLAKSNYYAKSLFKGDESALFKAAKMTPILSDIVDPYYLEKLHFYDRPYPTTGPSYPGLSIMGSLYAGTLGKLFKPEMTMHEEEWQVPGGIVAPAEDHAPIPELGGLPPEMPVSGYSLTQVGPEVVHRWAEAIGLPGWLGRLVIGADNWGDGSQFASAEQINSERRRYWDENLGGLMGNTEWYRRINPSLRRSITEQQYNPLRNTMPSWLPGPEDNFIDFRHGDPMAKIPQGEARLPGPGYVALHPELEGVDPENYPFLTRYKILADVAPYSKEAKEYAARATAMDQAGTLTPEEHLQAMDIKRKLSMVKKRKEFFEHQDFTERNLLGRGLGRYWETLSHDVEDLDVVEPLLPFRPLAKFIHQRDALEDYAMTQVYGTDAGFWNKPWADFLRPAKERLDEHLGDERIPQHVQTLRNTEEYFDRLKYLKSQMHARLARNAGDFDSAQEWLKASKKTLTGAQPYGSREDMLAIMEALPKRERDYYTEFSEETDPERREKILELVPEQVGRIYRLTWEADALRRTREAEAQGIIDASTSEVQSIEQALQVDLQTGGRLTPELLNQYQQEGTKQPLPEWLQEQELQLYFQDHPLPAAQSLIWDPRIDLEDVKLKVVTQEGADHHDYDIWDTQVRAANRKPYLDNILEDLKEERSPEEIRRQIRAICEGQGIEDLQVEVVPAGLSTSQVILTNNPDDDLRQRLFSIEHADRRPVRSAPSPRRQQRGRQPNERPL